MGIYVTAGPHKFLDLPIEYVLVHEALLYYKSEAVLLAENWYTLTGTIPSIVVESKSLRLLSGFPSYFAALAMGLGTVPATLVHRESYDKFTLRDYIWESRPHTCYLCGAPCDYCTFTLDHIYPQVEWGIDCLENLEVCCGTCNKRKKNRPLTPYLLRELDIKESHIKELAWTWERLKPRLPKGKIRVLVLQPMSALGFLHAKGFYTDHILGLADYDNWLFTYKEMLAGRTLATLYNYHRSQVRTFKDSVILDLIVDISTVSRVAKSRWSSCEVLLHSVHRRDVQAAYQVTWGATVSICVV